MTSEEHLLTIAAEECAEVAQRISKALRFSLDEIQEGKSMTNRELILMEYNDLVATMEMLNEKGVFGYLNDSVRKEVKKQNIKKWMIYAKAHGTIIDGNE